MRVVFRCDSSPAIGSGHVTRCLTLADRLRERGAETVFVCRKGPGDLSELVTRRGHALLFLEGPETDGKGEAEATARLVPASNWLVVDNYRLDARYESRLRPLFSGIVVIDDLADRPHDCDLLLDQNLHLDAETRYRGLVPEGCRCLLGPRYALLRPEFFEARAHLVPRQGTVRRLLVSFGGSDPTNETFKALEAVAALGAHGLALDVVAGGANPRVTELEAFSRRIPDCSFHPSVDNMAQLMARADLSLGSGGATTWERCFLGLPSLTVIVAENQRAGTEAVAAAGATANLGWHADLDSTRIKEALAGCLSDPSRLKAMAHNCFELMGEPAKVHPIVATMTENAA